jgi:hypothetical protein
MRNCHSCGIAVCFTLTASCGAVSLSWPHERSVFDAHVTANGNDEFPAKTEIILEDQNRTLAERLRFSDK